MLLVSETRIVAGVLPNCGFTANQFPPDNVLAVAVMLKGTPDEVTETGCGLGVMPDPFWKLKSMDAVLRTT